MTEDGCKQEMAEESHEKEGFACLNIRRNGWLEECERSRTCWRDGAPKRKAE